MAVGYANGVGLPLGSCASNRNLFFFNLTTLQPYSLTALQSYSLTVYIRF
jgi:hypothetical protein